MVIKACNVNYILLYGVFFDKILLLISGNIYQFSRRVKMSHNDCKAMSVKPDCCILHCRH